MTAMLIRSRDEAIALGLKRYFRSEPCANGHVAERAVSNGSCLKCKSTAAARYREESPEKYRAINRQYRRDHADKVRSYGAIWRSKNREKIRIANLGYREKNREARRAYTRRWVANNLERHLENKQRWLAANADQLREYYRRRYLQNAAQVRARTKQWRRDNPERRNTYDRNRRALALSAGGKHRPEDIEVLYDLQGGACTYCGADLADLGHHVDHDIPLSRGGSNGPENLCLACPPCNMRKHTMTGDEFRALLNSDNEIPSFAVPPQGVAA